ncbi:hypothetical protein HWV62_9579 [Athelia sp. TMB]|nr:hypothetical protein HWV62_9579 [Athelia sp. TMB]
MPALKAPAKVLVSGANGFVAIWVVRTLLENGYAVRGTVRSESKGCHLKEIFKEYGDKLELIVVPDITTDGAFDEAVKGVDAIEHAASPFHMNAQDPQVVTSSCAAVYADYPDARVFSERDWNEQAIKEVQEKGRDADPGNKYRASKTLAEKAAWAFVKENPVDWDLVVLNPPYRLEHDLLTDDPLLDFQVFGPPIHEVSSISALNTSSAIWYQTVLTSNSPTDDFKTGNCWVDVRDLAQGHLRALEKAEAGGERIVLAQGSFVWQDFLNEANALPKETLARLAKPSAIPRGDQSFKEETPLVSYDTSKATQVLKMGSKSPAHGQSADFTVLRSPGECTKAMVEEFAGRGW